MYADPLCFKFNVCIHSKLHIHYTSEFVKKKNAMRILLNNFNLKMLNLSSRLSFCLSVCAILPRQCLCFRQSFEELKDCSRCNSVLRPLRIPIKER